MLKLEDLQVDTHVAGIEPSAPVKLLYIKKAGDDAADVTYELLDGRVLKKTLFRADENKLQVASETRAWAFDASPESFKLAAEATRIKLAHLFDPMMAVHTSDVEPLPHQISAVYEAMLPKQPLRFVLADDPGAGKTIMAGLLIRELMLRGDLERCLIISPGSLVEQWQTELAEKFGHRRHRREEQSGLRCQDGARRPGERRDVEVQELRLRGGVPRVWPMRAIQYRRPGFKPQILLTSLVDPKLFPADEIRALYHERWEIELGYDEVKTDMLDRQEAIRSKTPKGVLQELWAIALAYNLVRLEMERIAEEADVAPSRISFVMSLRLIRDEWAWAAASSAPGAIPKNLRRLREELKRFILPPRRSERHYPRAVKIKMSNYDRNRPTTARRRPRK